MAEKGVEWGGWYLRWECADWCRDSCQFRVEVGIVVMSHEQELDRGTGSGGVWCGVVRTSTVNNLAADQRWFRHGWCVFLRCAVLSYPVPPPCKSQCMVIRGGSIERVLACRPCRGSVSLVSPWIAFEVRALRCAAPRWN